MADFPLSFLLQVKNEMSAGISQATSQLKTMGSEAQSSASKVKASGIGMGAGIALITTQLVSTINSIISLKRQWEDLTRAQNDVKQSGFSLANAKGKLSTATINLKNAQQGAAGASKQEIEIAKLQFKEDMKNAKSKLDVLKAHEALNKVLGKGGKDVDKITKANNTYQRALRGVQNATINQKEAQQNLQRATQDFYLQTIPTAIGVVGSFATVLATMRGNTGTVMGSFLKFTPVVIGIGAAFLALKTNFLGITTFFQNLGRDIGNAVPALKPLLNLIESIFATIGIGDTKKAKGLNNIAKQFMDSFKPIIDFFKEVVDNIMKGNWSKVFQMIVNAAKGAWIEIKKAFPIFGEIEMLVNKIQNGNWKGAFLQIWKAATDVWATIKKSVPLFGDIEKLIVSISQGKWGDAFNAIKKAVTDSGITKIVDTIFGPTWIANVTDRISSIPPMLTAAASLAKIAAEKGDWKSVGSTIGSAISQGMKASGGQDVIDAITNLGIGPASILQAIKDPKQVKMWANIGTEIGKQLSGVVKNAIDPFVASLLTPANWTAAFAKATKGASQIATALMNAIFPKDKSGGLPAVTTAVGNLMTSFFTGIGKWIVDNSPLTTRAITQIINSIRTAISDNIDKIRKLGDMLGRLIWNAMVDFLRSGASPLPFGNIIGGAISKRAAGFHGFTTGPTIVGERGIERVDVTPMSDIINRKPDKSTGGGRDIIHTHVYLNGKHIAEAVANEITVDQAVYR